MDNRRFGFSLYSSLMALAVVVSCTVSSSDGDGASGSGDCTPNRSIPCTCTNGDRGTQVCNSSGTGYGACTCEPGGGDAGAPSSTGGTNGTAGATSYGGEGYGGEGYVPTAGAGGEDVGPVAGGAGGADAVGGAGGGGGEPGLCDEPADPCQECYMGQCCDELAACLGDAQCALDFTAVRACSDDAVAVDDLASTADVDQCVQDVANASEWRTEVSDALLDLLDCMGGEPGWEDQGAWPQDSCRDGCFIPQ